MNLCKACHTDDWENDEFLTILDQLDLSFGREYKHRKHWEFAKAIWGLEKLGCLTPEALALGVGAGKEHVVYYLANRVGRVHAVDIYGSGDFAQSDAPAEMLIHPERFAPFAYRQERLVAQYMDGCDLKYPAECFDIVFSLSSIEHFGGHKAATRALQEMARVLRPGGTVALTTELILNGVSHPDFFLPGELETVLIGPSGLDLVEPIDLRVPPSLLADPLDLATDISGRYPHIVLKLGSAVFTSVIFFLQKRGQS
jgi:SAM-dependent methyltransferase